MSSTSSSRINPDDHGGRLVLAAALMPIYTFISIVIRFLSRRPKGWRSFYLEDAALIAAAVRHLRICVLNVQRPAKCLSSS